MGMKKLLCIILAVLMLFTLMACKHEEEPDIDTMPKFNTTDMVEFIGWGKEESNGIKLNSDREDVVFECVIDEGKLSLDDEEVKELTAKPDDIIYYIAAKNLDFVEIRMKSGEKLLAYALIEIYFYDYDFYYADEDRYDVDIYQPILLESEISDEQGFTEEYVSETIDYAKNYFPELTERQKKQIESIDDEALTDCLRGCIDTISYGTYNGALALFLPMNGLHEGERRYISGVSFCRYGGNPWFIFIIRDGAAYYLWAETIHSGIITQRDLEIIASMHAKCCYAKFGNNEY